MSSEELSGFEAEDEWRAERNRLAALAPGARKGTTALRDCLIGQVGAETVTVPCRQCGKPTLLSRYAYEFAKGTVTELLATKGEPPIEDGEIARCADCHATWHARRRDETERLRQEVVKLGQQVRDGRDLDPSQIAWLRKAGHGIAADGMEAIMKRRREGK